MREDKRATETALSTLRGWVTLLVSVSTTFLHCRSADCCESCSKLRKEEGEMETPWREQHASGISDDESWLHPLPCSGSFNVISQIPWLGAKGQIVARFLVVAAAMLMVRGKVPGFERHGCLLVCRPNEKGEASVQPTTRCR